MIDVMEERRKSIHLEEGCKRYKSFTNPLWELTDKAREKWWDK